MQTLTRPAKKKKTKNKTLLPGPNHNSLLHHGFSMGTAQTFPILNLFIRQEL
jgi:hypothetical protein